MSWEGVGVHPPPSPAWANFTLMIEYTPESDCCYSVYFVNIITAGNSISSQLGSSCHGSPVRYGKTRRRGLSSTYKITPTGSLSSSQTGGPPRWASPLAFGLTVQVCTPHPDFPLWKTSSFGKQGPASADGVGDSND
jgi:hypothetical protein